MAEFNETAIAALLFAEEGPVGQLVSRKATETVERARGYVAEIMHRMPASSLQDVLNNIDFEQEGDEAIVGIRDGGKIERYLDEKEGRELNWLFPAAAWTFVPED